MHTPTSTVHLPRLTAPRLAGLGLAVLALSAASPAQDSLVGLTHKTPFLVHQQMDGQACKHKQCQVLLHQARISALAGRWDFRRRAS